MKIAAAVLRDPARALGGEWLLDDGAGGWSSASLCGAATRRAHGLFFVRPTLAAGPLLLLARFEETLEQGGGSIELGTNQYPGTLHPRGFERLTSFTLEPLPTWHYELEGGARLSRQLARPRGRPGLVLVYQLEAQAPALLELRPLLACRRAGELRELGPELSAEGWRLDGEVVLQAATGWPALTLRLPRSAWTPDGIWYRSLEYEREREAGQAYREDLFSPGVLRVKLEPGEPLALLAWAGPIPPAIDALALVDLEKRRLRTLRDGDGFLADLRQSADALLGLADVSAPPLPGLAPGSARALPALAIELQRFDEARGWLDLALAQLGGERDADRCHGDTGLQSLLLVRRFVEAGGDPAPTRGPWKDALFALLEAHIDGRVAGRALAPHGLLAEVGADYDLRLTIDRQALWYNALLAGAELAREAGDLARASSWTLLAGRVRDAVVRNFWSEERGYLALEVGPDGTDWTIDARQLAAIALPHTLLPRERAQRALERVALELLTPLGLKQSSGEIRPLQAAAYFEGRIRIEGEQGKRAARAWLRDFFAHLEGVGRTMVPESFAAEPPHAPQGQPLDGVSVAELLRLAERVGREPARARR